MHSWSDAVDYTCLVHLSAYYCTMSLRHSITLLKSCFDVLQLRDSVMRDTVKTCLGVLPLLGSVTPVAV
jgi:hypothetical protein